MQRVDWYEEEPAAPKRCYRRDRAKDQASWRNGAAKAIRARWGLKSLPPIDPDDPWSTDLTLTEE